MWPSIGAVIRFLSFTAGITGLGQALDIAKAEAATPGLQNFCPTEIRTRHAQGAPRRGLGYGTSSPALLPLYNPKTRGADKQGYLTFSQHLNTLHQGSHRAAYQFYEPFLELELAQKKGLSRRSLAAARRWGECLSPKGPRGARNSVY